MKQWFFSIIFLLSLFVCVFVCPIDVYATSPAPLEPAPTLQVVKPQLEPTQQEALEYAYNRYGYVIPADFTFYAFLDFVKQYGDANWTEEEDFQYYVQPVIDASVLPESLQGLDANIYMAYVDYGFMKVGGYFDSAGNLLGGEYVKFSTQMDSLLNAFIDQLIDDTYYPDGFEQGANQMTFGNVKPVPGMSVFAHNIPTSQGSESCLFVDYKFTNAPANTYVYLIKVTSGLSSYYKAKYMIIAIKYNHNNNLSFSERSITGGGYNNISDIISQFNATSFTNRNDVTNYVISDGNIRVYLCYQWYVMANATAHTVKSPYIIYEYPTVQDFYNYWKNNVAKLTKGGIQFFPNGNGDVGAVGGQVLKGDSLAPYNQPLRDNLTKPLIIPTNPVPAVIPPVTPITPPAPVPIDDPAPGPSAPGSPTTPIQEENPDLAPFMFDLSNKFPFCVPFDLIKAFKLLVKPAVAPRYEWTLKVDTINLSHTFVLDLAPFEPLAKILRITIIISFVISLILITRNIISG